MSAALGRLFLLHDDGSDRQSFPLLKSTITFGRHSTNDVRIQVPSVSKVHAELRINAPSRTAELHVFSVNGVRMGDVLWRKGELGSLDHGDEFCIGGRTFRIELDAVNLAAQVETPARTAPLRYSLVAAATVDTPSKPVLAAPRRSWLPSLFGRSLQHSEEQPHECLGSLISLADHEEIPPPQPHENPAAYQNDLNNFWDEDEHDLALNAPDIVPVPIIPGSYDFSDRRKSDSSSSASSDEEIENLLVSPRSSPDPGPSRRSISAPILYRDRGSPPPSAPSTPSTPSRRPSTKASRRRSLREKVLIQSGMRLEVMARSNSMGNLVMSVGPSPPGVAPPRRSSLPNENALADVLPLDIKPLHLPTFDRIVKSAFDDDVDAPDDEGDEEEDSDGSTSRSPSPDPQQELSPRALRAARRSGSLELPLPPTAEEEVKLVAAPVAPIEAPVEEAFEPFVETVGVVKDEEQEEDPFSYAQYDTSSDSDSSTFSSYVDRVVPLGGEGDAPVTPRPQLKPRKSALKTPPPPSSDEASPPSSALRSLKRKVSWHEQLNNYREIPHREDLPEVKRAKLEEEEAAARRAAELAKPMVTRRSSLVFVQEHPELHFAPSVSTPNAPSAAPSTPAAPVAQVSTTPKRAPTTPRVPHSAGRARVGPPAASVQRAVVATATTSDAMTTPRKTPLRKPGRSVSPVKRDVADTLFNFCPIDLEPPQVRSDLAQLLASPLRKLGTFTLSPIKPPPLTLVGETPRTAPTVERLLAQIESIRKPLGTPSQPALAPFDLLGETPGQALLPMLSAAPAAPATPTPAAAVASAPSLQGISTPYLAGVRQLYKPAPPVVETPRFGGVKQLFHVPSVAVFSPQLEGVRELLISPEKPVEAVLETAHDVAIEEKPVVVVAEFEAREPARSILPVRAGPGRAKSASVEAKPSVVPKRAPRKPAAPVIAADLPEVGTATADAPVSSSSTSSAASRSTRSRSTSVSKPKATAATRTKPKATGGDVTSSTRLPARAKVKVADKENTSPVEPPVATLGGVGKASSLEPTTRSGRVLRSRKV